MFVGAPGTKDWALAKDLVVLLRRDVTVMPGGNDGAIRERKFPFTIGVDRYIVAQDGT